LQVFTISLKSMTQLNVKDLIERQDKLEVMMDALMGKIHRLSTKMINKHNVPYHKRKEVKRSTRRALSHLDKCVSKNSNDDVVNHGRKSCTH